MSIDLSFGKPVVVARGPVLEEVGWGPYQFPAIFRMPDGRIVVPYHIGNDTTSDYGGEEGWAVSSDNGASFSPANPAELPILKAYSGIRMPSGNYIRNITPKNLPITPELHAELTKNMGRRKFCVAAEDIPEGLLPMGWTMAETDANTGKEDVYISSLDWPGMTLGLAPGSIIRPFTFGNLKYAPDGSLWVAHYCHGRNPENLGFTSYYACYFFRSTDDGRSFKLMSWIQYLPDTNEFADAFTTEGFCEPDICFMQDGSIITVMRTGSWTPSYIARSTDGGKTWSKPVKFDNCGVLPQLLTLGNGVTIATYGRPGLFARATVDPAGMDWEAPVELMPPLPDHQEASCYYTRLLPVSDDTAIMVYSDFFWPDEDGTPRKTILARTVSARI